MIDMTNKKVGLLTILYRDNTKPTGKGKEVFWICKCECGQLTSVRGSDLRREKTKSCGCLNKQQAKINITHTINHKIKQENKQLLDKTFGFLKVLEVEDNIAKCQCLLCGNICYTKIKYLKNGHKQSCGCLVSKGEAKISQILKENNINFEQQKTFDTCRFLDTNALAKFDFYLPDYNLLIEFDGEQHFHYTNQDWNTKEHFEKVQAHDEFKNQWCKNNNIPLIRVPYWHLKNLSVKDLLSDIKE